ncbi:metallophosphoesterase [Staphylococcus shinii]|uniref:metallophosphoesterase n=1 Tax=Staphylococcus shinii TaxID=2912228 RepID=UPI003F567EC7
MKKRKYSILFSLSVASFLIISSDIYADSANQEDRNIHNKHQIKNECSDESKKSAVNINSENSNDPVNSEKLTISNTQSKQDETNNELSQENAGSRDNYNQMINNNTEFKESEDTKKIQKHSSSVNNPGNSYQDARATNDDNNVINDNAPNNSDKVLQKSLEPTTNSNNSKNELYNDKPQVKNNITSTDVKRLATQETEGVKKSTANRGVRDSDNTNKNQQQNQTQSNEHRYPILTIGPNQSEKNLTWYHESDEQGYVEVAEANDTEDFSEATRIKGQTYYGSNTGLFLNKEVPNMNYTHATLANLKENTEYMYRFYNGDNGKKSAVHRFNMHNNGETNFIAVADPQLGASGNLEQDNEGWKNTIKQMKHLNQNSDFLLSLGDQVNKPWDEQAYSGFIEAEGMENFTVVPILGNHDRANKAFSQHFNLPNLQDGGKNLASSNFYYTHNDTLFVSLNSESLDFKGHEETLKRAIADTKDQNPKWIVGLMHRNPYSSGKHSDTLATKNRRNHIAPLMEKYNVDLVLGGHDHSYSRSHIMKGKNPQIEWDENGEALQNYTNPEGTLYVTLNSSSGSKFYDLNGDKDYAAKAIQNKKPTFSKVNITDSYIEILTYNVPQGSEALGDPIDRVRINKT